MIGRGARSNTDTAPRARLRAVGAVLGLALAVTGTTPALGGERSPSSTASTTPSTSPSSASQSTASADATAPSPSADAGTPVSPESAESPHSPGTATPIPEAEVTTQPEDEVTTQPEDAPTPAEGAAPEQPQRLAAEAAADLGLAISAPAWAYIHTEQTLTVTLKKGTTPVADAEVLVRRWRPGLKIWETTTYTTDADGKVLHPFRVRPGVNRFRARLADDGTVKAGPLEVRGRRIATTLTLDGDAKVVDERWATLNIRWVAADGRKVTGRVALYRKPRGTTQWTLMRRPTVEDGVVTVRVRPRTDTVWRAAGAAGLWFRRGTSPLHRLDNVPPGRPVVMPAGAPTPSLTLPAQRRAVGAGLNARVTKVPRLVWRSMVGRSWHRGCPVGRSGLRLVTLNYWGFDGYRHRGEIVLSASAAGPAVNTFGTLYDGRYPIRSMYRVDRFGWSKRLGGANDYKSMAADNTSGFNCRQVVGRPGVMSPHSYGGSIDINPWENPYVSRQGTYPNTWWLSQSHPRVAWRSWSHPVVAAFTSQGFAWGGAYRDYHHFQR